MLDSIIALSAIVVLLAVVLWLMSKNSRLEVKLEQQKDNFQGLKDRSSRVDSRYLASEKTVRQLQEELETYRMKTFEFIWTMRKGNIEHRTQVKALSWEEFTKHSNKYLRFTDVNNKQYNLIRDEIETTVFREVDGEI